MVDLAMLQVVRDLVAIFGVIAGFTYYVLTVRNTQKNQQLQLETRQAQLFMQIYDKFTNKEYVKDWVDFVFLQEFDDYQEYMEKYGYRNNLDAWASRVAISDYFEGI
jgi:hypothetical protein